MHSGYNFYLEGRLSTPDSGVSKSNVVQALGRATWPLAAFVARMFGAVTRLPSVVALHRKRG
jgi:hypothetical protein